MWWSLNVPASTYSSSSLIHSFLAKYSPPKTSQSRLRYPPPYAPLASSSAAWVTEKIPFQYGPAGMVTGGPSGQEMVALSEVSPPMPYELDHPEELLALGFVKVAELC